MSGTSTAFSYWKILPTLSVWETACILAGFDPRAISDVTDENGSGLDLEEETRLLVSAIYAQEISVAASQTAPYSKATIILRRSLVRWLANDRYREIANALSDQTSFSAQQPQEQFTPPASEVKELRGCELMISDHWEGIKKQYGAKANGRNVHTYLKKALDPDDKLPTVKTVQNCLITLRNSGRIS